MITLTTQEAINVLRSLSPANYREDQVFVDCQTEGENRLVDVEASNALENGYVKKYITALRTHDLRVVIDFCKPIFIEDSL